MDDRELARTIGRLQYAAETAVALDPQYAGQVAWGGVAETGEATAASLDLD